MIYTHVKPSLKASYAAIETVFRVLCRSVETLLGTMKSMILYMTTRVPVDNQYAALVGKAVYVFAYYEWTIIWIIEYLEPSFVGGYSRGNPMTSGAVQKRLQDVTNNLLTNYTNISRQELQACCDAFASLIVKRNALIHAHPCTDADGAQILAYQTKTSKPQSMLPHAMQPWS